MSDIFIKNKQQGYESVGRGNVGCIDKRQDLSDDVYAQPENTANDGKH